MKAFQLVIFTLLSFQFTGCAVLLGNIDPGSKKSEEYGYKDLSKFKSQWKKLNTQNSLNSIEMDLSAEEKNTRIPDVVYQSQITHSTISLNSSCKKSNSYSQHQLSDFTNTLLMGFSRIKEKHQTVTMISKKEALQTTILGKIENQKIKVRTIVTQINDCIYDFMYISRPQFFEKEEADFSYFVTSTRLD